MEIKLDLVLNALELPHDSDNTKILSALIKPLIQDKYRDIFKDKSGSD
jgi:hypothetical protein